MTNEAILYVVSVINNLREKGYIIEKIDLSDEVTTIQYKSNLLDLSIVLKLDLKNLGLA